MAAATVPLCEADGDAAKPGSVTTGRRRYGAFGEARAAAWYRTAGYEVLAQNWRCGDGELDLVCRRGTTVVVCEVKARRSVAFGHPAEAVTATKRRRIRRLATQWLAEHRPLCPSGPVTVRFDVASVLGSTVSVLTDAF